MFSIRAGSDSYSSQRQSWFAFWSEPKPLRMLCSTLWMNYFSDILSRLAQQVSTSNPLSAISLVAHLAHPSKQPNTPTRSHTFAPYCTGLHSYGRLWLCCTVSQSLVSDFDKIVKPPKSLPMHFFSNTLQNVMQYHYLFIDWFGKDSNRITISIEANPIPLLETK